jgi:hypothetical protein
MHNEPHPLAGKTVKIKQGVIDPAQGLVVGGAEYRIEDWADRLYGKSIWLADGNPAAMHYAFRLGAQLNRPPADDECVYGKIRSLGHVVHVTELDLEGVPA